MGNLSEQFNEIMKEYEATRFENERIVDNRHKEIREKIKDFSSLEDKISNLSISAAKERIYNPSFDMDNFHQELARLITAKNDILAKNGYDTDYLNPIYVCKDCEDTGFINNHKCHCLIKKLIQARYNQSHIAQMLSNDNFSNFTFDYYTDEQRNAMQNVYSASHNFIESFDTEFKNLFFYGDVGTGKTFFTNCIAKELLDRGKSVIYFTAPAIIEAITSTFKHNSEITSESLYEDIFNCDLLILDDLGTESYNSLTVEKIFVILNERLSRHKSTIISTNMDFRQITDIYSERSISRILGCYDVFVFRGDDLRLKIRKSKS